MKDKYIVFLFATILFPVVTAAAQSTIIEYRSKVYIEPNEGYESYIAAALAKKGTPVVVVTDRESADFEIRVIFETGSEPGFARRWLLGQHGRDESASFTVTDLASGVVAFAYNVDKKNAARGKQSTAESFAKHLKKKMEKNAKRR